MRSNESMATHQYRTLTKRIVDRLAVNDKDAVFWDREIPGFGLRVADIATKCATVRRTIVGTGAGFERSRHRYARSHYNLMPTESGLMTDRRKVHVETGTPLLRRWSPSDSG